MELLFNKTAAYEYSYYIDHAGRTIRHGVYIGYYPVTSRFSCVKAVYYHGQLHGEYLRLDVNGLVVDRMLMVNGNHHPCIEMSEQEKLLFQIQYPGFRFIED